MRRVGRMALILSGDAVVLLVCWRQFAPGVLVEVLEGDNATETAFTERRSGIIVEAEGQVLRELPGKPQDVRQRFVIGLRNGHRLVVSHDLEFADEVPVAPSAAEIPRFWMTGEDMKRVIGSDAERLQRSIGVVYRPETERRSHYLHRRLADELDLVIHLDSTRSTEPLDVAELDEPRASPGEMPETRPTGG